MKPFTRIVALLAAIQVTTMGSAAVAAEAVYTLGVVPQFDPRRLSEIWQPIIDELKRQTGLRLVLRFSPSIPEFEKEFSRGEFDFAYMNPYHLIVAHRKQGYQPLLRDVGRQLYGIIVVRKESELQSIEELDGKKVAFPAPNALGAALIPRAEFANKFNISVDQVYARSHSSVYLNVILGVVDAGGGVQKTLMQQPPEIREQLRVLYKTTKVSPHPIAAHKRVPEDVQQRVLVAFLNMGRSETGKQQLARIPIKEIGLASLEDYDPLCKMGLESFYVE